MAGERDVFRAALARHIGDAHVEMLGHALLDVVNAHAAARLLLQEILQQHLHALLRQRAAAERDERRHAHERAFEPADVCADALCEKFNQRRLDLHAERGGLLLQNRGARLHIRRLQLGGHAPLEARDEARLEVVDLRGRAVGGEDDLLVAVEERVERVKKFLLRAFLAGEELDVVNEQHVHLAVALAEFHERAVLDRVNELVRELLARDVGNFRTLAVREDMLADGVHEVRFPESHSAVEKERVVNFARRLRDGAARGVRKLVVRADDERLKCVARVHAVCDGLFLDLRLCRRDHFYLHNLCALRDYRPCLLYHHDHFPFFRRDLCCHDHQN